jgi:hypothetical protein
VVRSKAWPPCLCLCAAVGPRCPPSDSASGLSLQRESSAWAPADP